MDHHENVNEVRPVGRRRGWPIVFFLLAATGVSVQADPPPLGPADVLILVNGDSPCGKSVADLYRRYHPQITAQQVLYLYGLPDSASKTATAATEIITRVQFENLIAQPTRNYLINSGLVDNVYCLITTAGMPYRIEDTDPNFADVIYPRGSNYNIAYSNRNAVNAASVEAELAVLFQIDPALNAAVRLPINGRVVNPYQGYASGIKCWAGYRDILNRRSLFTWDERTLWKIEKHPRIEGRFDWAYYTPCGFSALNRQMCPADIYLLARLDGPRMPGEYPIFAVKRMLDRAAWAGSPAVGYNPAISAEVIDNAPAAQDILALTKILNFPPLYDFLYFNTRPIPPGAEEFTSQFNEYNHFMRTYSWLTLSGSDPPAGGVVTSPIQVGLGGSVVWDGTNAIMNRGYLGTGTGIIGLMTYGCNGGDGRPSTYLLTSGPGGGPLFKCVPGAVFLSLESFNAVSMFIDQPTLPVAHGRIADFITIGGTGAIGHSFEPGRCATIQGDYLMRNLLRDDDGDGVGDLTLAEAAFTALPYLSWTEVLIGDPLMRLCRGPGALVNSNDCPADVDGNGVVNFWDHISVVSSPMSKIGQTNYYPERDVNRDGVINGDDLSTIKAVWNMRCPSN